MSKLIGMHGTLRKTLDWWTFGLVNVVCPSLWVSENGHQRTRIRSWFTNSLLTNVSFNPPSMQSLKIQLKKSNKIWTKCNRPSKSSKNTFWMCNAWQTRRQWKPWNESEIPKRKFEAAEKVAAKQKQLVEKEALTTLERKSETRRCHRRWSERTRWIRVRTCASRFLHRWKLKFRMVDIDKTARRTANLDGELSSGYLSMTPSILFWNRWPLTRPSLRWKSSEHNRYFSLC